MNGRLTALITLLLGLLMAGPMAARESSKEKIMLETRLSPRKPMQGEPVLYEVVLVTSNPSVAGTGLKVAPDFTGLEVRRESADSRFHEEVKDGKSYYVAVIDRIRLFPTEAGSYKVGGGCYVVGIGRQVVIDDPFWGPVMGNDIEEREFNVKPVSFTVRKLPESGRPDGFKGAVGNFSVEMEIPKGDIVKGEEAIAIVTIRGVGALTESMVPELRKSFPEGLDFKSASPELSEYMENDNLCSELEIECLFTPSEEGTFTVSPIQFVFYDRDKRKYVMIESNPVNLEVLPSSSPESPPVFIEI